MKADQLNSITSPDNPKIKHLKKLIDNKQYRYAQKEFVAEGINLLDRANNVKELYTLDQNISFPNAKTFLITEKILRTVSTVENSQGTLALCAMTAPELKKSGRYVLLDGIQDPGNLGTIIRTAAGFDYTGVIIGPGCADPFSPKVVRSTMGALFTMDIVFLKEFSELKNRQLIVADGQGEPARNIKPAQDHILVIGSESRGPSEELVKMAQLVVAIPRAKRSSHSTRQSPRAS
jgi:TrmH family RNA methyltransferase